MKHKTLTQNEVKKRAAQAFTEIFASLFGISEKEATKTLLSDFKEELQDDNGLARAAIFYTLNKKVKSAIKRGRNRRRFTEEELEAALAQLKAYAPEMASAIRKGMKGVMRNLPQRGGPGRTEALTSTQKREACEQVGILHKMGKVKKWSDIFESVAQNFKASGTKVSARTIKRVWQDRESLYVG